MRSIRWAFVWPLSGCGVAGDRDGPGQERSRRTAADIDLDVAALDDPLARRRRRGVRLEVVEVLEADRDRDLLLLARFEVDAREALQLLRGPPRRRAEEPHEHQDDLVTRDGAAVRDVDDHR